MEKDSISIQFVLSALEPVVDRGIDPSAMLEAAGIAPDLLQSPGHRVSAASFSAIWISVARILDDELFGQDSRRMKSGSFAMLCHALLTCDTLESALERMARFFNLVLDDFHCSLESDMQQAYLSIRPASPQRMPRPFGYETLLMMQHGVACWLIGRRIPILAAAFAYPEPARSGEYVRMYSENLRFDHDVTCLTFDRSYLARPVIQDASTVKAFLRGAPGNIVVKYHNKTGVPAQIRRTLRAMAFADWPTFESLASSLNMTGSTLRRRLEHDGQSFQTIKDQLRRDIAIDALGNSDRSIGAIAAQLGFAEPSAFHRAFKKWTGSAPGDYRDRIRPPPA